MELVVEVVGMKCFKGRVQGSDIDSGSIYGIVKLDERYNRQDQEATNWKLGHAVEEWKVPRAEVVMRMAHLKPSIKNPVSIRLEIERVSNGKETTEVVIDAVPVNGSIVDQNTGEIRHSQPHPQPQAAPQPIKKAA